MDARGHPWTPVHPLRRSAISVAASTGTRNPESERLLHALVKRSQRKTGAPLPWSFVRGAVGEVPPLTRMLRGGQGGEVRLKLYLCICLRTTKAPHNIRQAVPSRSWAELLGLAEPATNGARRVSDALAWLHKHDFIDLERSSRGVPASLSLLDPGPGRDPFVRPTGRWIRVPLGLWSNEWIVVLSGTAIAVLLVLIELTGGKKDPAWVTGERREQYALSEETWSRGVAELKGHGLLKIGQIVQAEEFDFQRRRNTYKLDLGRLDEKPGSALPPSAVAAGFSTT